jgi:hypothetical protein
VEQHAEQDAAMTTLQAKKATQKMDKRFRDKNSIAKPDSPGAGCATCDDSTATKYDDDNDEEDATAKPDSQCPGDEKRDDSTATKDDVDESTAKRNSPYPGDERRDNIRWILVNESQILMLP